MRNDVVFNNKSKTKIRFNDMIVKSSSTERMLQDVTPFEWSQDVLSGDSKVDINIKQEKNNACDRKSCKEQLNKLKKALKKP